jgi:hypothetical protein
MRLPVLALAVASFILGCESNQSTAEQRPVPGETASAARPSVARAELAELTIATTLAPVRAAFNAKKGEARFLTLLSPT